MRTEIRNLKVVLTYDELQEKGQDLAKANRDIAEKEAQKKRVTTWRICPVGETKMLPDGYVIPPQREIEIIQEPLTQEMMF